MSGLTICYITCRRESVFHWFAESLRNQLIKFPDLKIQIIAVDYFYESEKAIGIVERTLELFSLPNLRVDIVRVLPSFCQGEHKLTKEDYFDASIARNTGFVYA